MSNPVTFFWPSEISTSDYVALEQEGLVDQPLVLNEVEKGRPFTLEGMGRQLKITVGVTLGIKFYLKGRDLLGNILSEMVEILSTDTEGLSTEWYHIVDSIYWFGDTPGTVKVGLGPIGLLGWLNMDYNRPYWNATIQTNIFLNMAANTSRYTVFGSVFKPQNILPHIPESWPNRQEWFYTDNIIFGAIPTMTQSQSSVIAQLPYPVSTVAAYIDYGAAGADENFQMGLSVLQQGI